MKVFINNNNKRPNDSSDAQEAISKRRDTRNDKTTSDDLDFNNMEVVLLKSTADDLQEMEDIELEEVEEQSSTSLNTTPKAMDLPKKSRYPWQSQFLTKYPWLHYDPQTEMASCSESKCKMYHYHLSEEANESTWTCRFENRLFQLHQDSKGHFTKHLPIPERGQQQLSLP